MPFSGNIWSAGSVKAIHHHPCLIPIHCYCSLTLREIISLSVDGSHIDARCSACTRFQLTNWRCLKISCSRSSQRRQDPQNPRDGSNFTVISVSELIWGGYLDFIITGTGERTFFGSETMSRSYDVCLHIMMCSFEPAVHSLLQKEWVINCHWRLISLICWAMWCVSHQISQFEWMAEILSCRSLAISTYDEYYCKSLVDILALMLIRTWNRVWVWCRASTGTWAAKPLVMLGELCKSRDWYGLEIAGGGRLA